MSSSFSELSLAELTKAVVAKTADLRAHIGPCADYMCDVCGKLASQHIGGVVTGCVDKEIDEAEIKATLIDQLQSAEDTLNRLKAERSLGLQVSQMLLEKVEMTNELCSLKMVASENVVVLREVNKLWASYVSGRIEPSVLVARLNVLLVELLSIVGHVPPYLA